MDSAFFIAKGAKYQVIFPRFDGHHEQFVLLDRRYEYGEEGEPSFYT